MAKAGVKNRRTKTQEVAAWRFFVVVALLCTALLLLVWRVLSLQVLDTERGYEFLQNQGYSRAVRTEVIPGYRGKVLDRNGQPLAVSTPMYTIGVNPKILIEDETHWAELAGALGITLEGLAQRLLNNSEKEFIYLKRQISPTDSEQIMGLKIPGVYRRREYRRFYPAGEVAAHLVGYTDIDGRGREGIELAYQDWLHGEPGQKKVLKDLRGNVIREIDAGKPAKPGSDLMLSIDLRLQYQAYRELKAAMQRYGAKSGSVVTLDSRTGEVLAMVNQPSYNPNNRRQLDLSSVRNRATTDVIEPGSTMKALTLVAALESGQFSPRTKIDTNPGYIRVGSKTLLDPVNYGVIDVTKILSKSSQVGTSKIALALDEQKVWEVFHRFGLGESTGSGFPGESNGSLPNRSRWRPIERVNFAFGYGLSATPLQLAKVYSVLANDGQSQPVSLLRQDQQTPARKVIDQQIADQVVAMLETVTLEGGTATRAQVDGYSVAGKTGTVHKIGQGGYADDRYIALFAGFAPATDPRVVTVVVINEPDINHYHGGEAAAPVFSNITSAALRILNVAPDQAVKKQLIGAHAHQTEKVPSV